MPELTEGELLNVELKRVLKLAGKTSPANSMSAAEILARVLKNLGGKADVRECVEYSIRKLLLKYEIQERTDPGAVRYENDRFWFDTSRKHENQSVDSTCGVAHLISASHAESLANADTEKHALASNRASSSIAALLSAIGVIHEKGIITDLQFIDAIKKIAR